MSDTILQRIGEIIGESSVEEVDWSTVTSETTLDSFGFDSLTVLDLIFDLEQDFGVKIEAEEMVAMKTVGELVDFVKKNS